MYNNEKANLKWKTQIIYLFLRFQNGCRFIKTNKRTWAHLAGILIAVAGLFSVSGSLASSMQTDLFTVLFLGIFQMTIPLAAFVAMLLTVIHLGTPIGAYSINSNLQRIGLTNSAGESPLLVGRRNDVDNTHVIILDFMTLGIPVTAWEDTKIKLETAFDMYVVKIEQGHTLRRVLLHVVPAGESLPTFLPWMDSYLDDEEFSLVLGEDLARQQVKVNLNIVPHGLLGGSTGSGKTGLLKLMLMQAIKKGATVTIADLKGGMDFTTTIWRDNCRILTDKAAIAMELSELVQEIERRLPLFRAAMCSNLDEYNRKMVEEMRLPLKRVIFACDEASQLLDRTGLSKGEKEEIEVITSHLKTIARLGRAVGFHLLIAQQRPSADVLPGDIKNNADFRTCGRADDVLSRIILDNGDAADRIPKHSQGRFLMSDGTIFQAYWFDEARPFQKEGCNYDNGV